MKNTIVTGSLIVFSDGFVWKRLSNEKAYKIWVSAENEDFELYKVRVDDESESLIESLEDLQDAFKQGHYVCIEVGKLPYSIDLNYLRNLQELSNKIQDMERLNFETLFRVVRWDYNRCFKDESLDKDLFMEKYGKVMGEHYYNKFVHEFNGNILKMIGYFRGSEKEGQVFCDMITECIEKYEQRGLYSRGKLNN